VDAAYTGSQKCLSAPPGAAPLFLGPRAIEKLRGRGTKPATYNLDLNLIGDYWGWFGKRRCGFGGVAAWRSWGERRVGVAAATGLFCCAVSAVGAVAPETTVQRSAPPTPVAICGSTPCQTPNPQPLVFDNFSQLLSGLTTINLSFSPATTIPAWCLCGTP
jgi:hypothetical protein